MTNQTNPPSEIPAETHRMKYCPALDGLRAISVLMVLAVHLKVTSGGFLGVDIFFVLSGFLISNILLNELQAEHRINFLQFYLRRARRLAPGLFALLLLAGLLWRSTMGHESFLGAAIPALFYYQNWALCFKTLGSVGILAQTWSLSIEEQFYIFWPLLLVLLIRLVPDSRRAAVLVGVLTLGLAGLRTLLYCLNSPLGSYVSTLARADAILVGCIFALAKVLQCQAFWQGRKGTIIAW